MFKKIISKVFWTAAVIFIAWFIISYFDVIANQMNGGTRHLWNLFVMFK